LPPGPGVVAQKKIEEEPPVTARRTDFGKRDIASRGGVRRQGRFNILNFEGIENIFNTAGELAAFFASPGFQKQQRIARSRNLLDKGKRADLKQTDTAIESTAKALDSVGISDEVKNTLEGQLNDLIERRRKIVSGQGEDSVLNDAARFLKAGFSPDETKLILERLGA